jgi:hypothetical protein
MLLLSEFLDCYGGFTGILMGYATHSDQVNQFRSAVGQFGAGRYIGLSIGNEVGVPHSGTSPQLELIFTIVGHRTRMPQRTL